MEENILNLEFNETIEFCERDIDILIRRVYKGWIYTTFSRGNDMGSSVFVSDDREA